MSSLDDTAALRERLKALLPPHRPRGLFARRADEWEEIRELFDRVMDSRDAYWEANRRLDSMMECAAESRRARPTIVCLCGSTRFYAAWQEANFRETVAGKIVLSVGFYPHAADKAHAAHVGITPEQKVALDALHFRKIELADEVLILNVGGYIGESTRNELNHARGLAKVIRFLEPEL